MSAFAAALLLLLTKGRADYRKHRLEADEGDDGHNTGLAYQLAYHMRLRAGIVWAAGQRNRNCYVYAIILPWPNLYETINTRFSGDAGIRAQFDAVLRVIIEDTHVAVMLTFNERDFHDVSRQHAIKLP